MDNPYKAGPDVHVLPTSLTIPGVGTLPVNAFVLHAEQPVLIDTGLSSDGDQFIDALTSVIDPTTLRWVWLTHDDSDHTGNIARIFELAPQAQLVTHALGALRMTTWWPVPLKRVHAIRPGDELNVGDRTLTAVKPPLFDNPTSIGISDSKSGTLFSVDTFGGILPGPCESTADVPPEALAGGMLAWASFDSPWSHLLDRQLFGSVVDGLRSFEPSQILSSHLPAATGTSLGSFLDLVASVPDAEPFVAPDAAAFQQIADAILASAPPDPAA